VLPPPWRGLAQTRHRFPPQQPAVRPVDRIPNLSEITDMCVLTSQPEQRRKGGAEGDIPGNGGADGSFGHLENLRSLACLYEKACEAKLIIAAGFQCPRAAAP